MTQVTATIRADQLTEGDIIQYRPGDNWMVITEPEYTTRGISFDVLCLDVEAPLYPAKFFIPGSIPSFTR